MIRWFFLFFSTFAFFETSWASRAVHIYGSNSYKSAQSNETHLKISRLNQTTFKIESCSKKPYQKGQGALKCQLIKNKISYQQLNKIHLSLNAKNSSAYYATSQNGGLYFKKSSKTGSGWLGLIGYGDKKETSAKNQYHGGTGLALAVVEIHFLGQRNKIHFDPEDTKKVVSFKDSTLYLASSIEPVLKDLRRQFK